MLPGETADVQSGKRGDLAVVGERELDPLEPVRRRSRGSPRGLRDDRDCQTSARRFACRPSVASRNMEARPSVGRGRRCLERQPDSSWRAARWAATCLARACHRSSIFSLAMRAERGVGRSSRQRGRCVVLRRGVGQGESRRSTSKGRWAAQQPNLPSSLSFTSHVAPLLAFTGARGLVSRC